jgi:Methyltransferase domain
MLGRLKEHLKRYTPLAILSFAPSLRRGILAAAEWSENDRPGLAPGEEPNPLREYFNSVTQGPGIWKWDHYFDIYHRHLRKFVGQKAHIAEVGVYSGGSLRMWERYFGPHATIYGVDRQPECKVYETAQTKIFIGDQADRSFWGRFRQQVPELDALIDDGGHQLEQRIVTLQEIVPHLRPGGVYICEDVSGVNDKFAAYVHGLSSGLNAFHAVKEGLVIATPLQRFVCSAHFYPLVTVIEKHAHDTRELTAAKRGTEWQPFPWS